MIRIAKCFSTAIVLVGAALCSAGTASAARPDLRIRQLRFDAQSAKLVHVLVVNTGDAPAGPNVVRLTVRRINGIPTGRVTDARVPALPAKRSVWVSVNADRILPRGVALSRTTFRLDVDALNQVAESSERNNQVWHNL